MHARRHSFRSYTGDNLLYRNSKGQQQAVKYFLRLAATEPTEFATYNPNKAQFESDEFIVRLKLIVHMILGATFKLYKNGKPPKQGKSTQQNKEEVTNIPEKGTKAARKPPPKLKLKGITAEQQAKNPYSKQNETTAESQPAKAEWIPPPKTQPKNMTFFTCQFPSVDPFPSGNARFAKWDEAKDHLLQIFFNEITRVDDNARIIKFPTVSDATNAVKWIHKRSKREKQPKGQQFSHFFHGHFFRQNGTSSKVRILIGHDVPAETLVQACKPTFNSWDETEEADNATIRLEIDPIQDADFTNVAWLKGTGYWTNTENLAQAIREDKYFVAKEKSLGRNILIDLRYAIVKDSPSDPWNRDGPSIRAVMVTCAAKDYSIVEALLDKIYDSRRKTGYPQYKKFQVVLDRGSRHFATSRNPGVEQMFMAQKEKQGYLINSMKTYNLERAVENPGPLSEAVPVDLYAAVSAIVDNSSEFSKQPVFVSLDQDPKDPSIWKLTYREDRQEEAQATAQRLGHALAKHFGPLGWNFFTKEYKRRQESEFKYNEKTKILESRADRALRRLTQSKQCKREFELENLEFVEQCQIENIGFRIPGAFRQRSAAEAVAQNGSEVSTTATTLGGDHFDMSTLNTAFEMEYYDSDEDSWDDEVDHLEISSSEEDEEGEDNEDDIVYSYGICDLDHEMNTIVFNETEHKYFGAEGLIPADQQESTTKIFLKWYDKVKAEGHWTTWTKEDCTKFVMYAMWRLPFKKPKQVKQFFKHASKKGYKLMEVMHLLSWDLIRLFYEGKDYVIITPVSWNSQATIDFRNAEKQVQQTWIYNHPGTVDAGSIPAMLVLIKQMPKETADHCWELWRKCLQTRQMDDFIDFQHSVHDWWTEIAAMQGSVIRQYDLVNDQLVGTTE